MTLLLSRRTVGITGALAATLSAALYSYSGTLIPLALYGTTTAPVNMPVNLDKIGKNIVKKVPSMEEVPLETLWANQTVVLTFLRRFGCLFCRQGAKELSAITPLLEANGVKNVAVGLEEFGLDDFVKGGFFNGDLYVDIDKKTYKDIGYKRFGTIGVLLSLFSKQSRDRIARNREENLESNLKGDGLQTGGTMVITKGGAEVLLDYRQENPADHVEIADILRVLKIQNPEDSGAAGRGGEKQ